MGSGLCYSQRRTYSTHTRTNYRCDRKKIQVQGCLPAQALVVPTQEGRFSCFLAWTKEKESLKRQNCFSLKPQFPGTVKGAQMVLEGSFYCSAQCLMREKNLGWAS